MIVDPKIGQRVFRLWRHSGNGEWSTIRDVCPKRLVIEYDYGGRLDMPSDNCDLYATASEAAEALISEGQRLIEAGERLKQEHK